ncbi:MAG: hypothetical protein RL497_1732 [Pseudomonadota bacterium]|jgi:rare lipoprotein A
MSYFFYLSNKFHPNTSSIDLSLEFKKKRLLFIPATIGILFLLFGCSTNKPGASSHPPEAQPNQPSTTAKKSRYSLLEDQGPDVDIDVTNIPNATPKKEERTIAGNLSPYTVLGKTYSVQFNSAKHNEVGLASWYGKKFHGERTSNGEIYNMFAMTAAHKTLPIPCYVRVTNLANNKNVILRVNDRGPFHEDRVIDLSYTAAKKLDYHRTGTAKVRVEIINMGDFSALPFVVVKTDNNTKSSNKPTAAATTATAIKTTPLPAPPNITLTTKPTETKLIAAETKPNTAKPYGNTPIYLQAGAFASEASAISLQKNLRTQTKYPVVLVPVDNKKIFRVLIGPFANLAETQLLKQILTEKKLSTPYVVTAAQPLEK